MSQTMAVENLFPLKYDALKHEPAEFRLISLLPNSSDGYIRCNLETHLLQDPPEYTALSYCWGSLAKTKTIVINGSSLQITPNLEEALHHLQGHYKHLFVDAICINQSDNDERTKQVQLMRVIYAESITVAAWVGQSDKIAERAIKAITAESGFNMFQYDAAAVGQFLCRPFWKRVWVIQEIAVARSVVLHCGSHVFTWKSLEPILSYSNFVNSPFHRPFINIVNLRLQIHTGEMIPLFSTLFGSSTALATDVRDKIFAVLGLVDDGTGLMGLPDYRLSVPQISVRMTKIFLKHTDSMNWICFRFRGGSHIDTVANYNENYPSWAVRWIDDLHNCETTKALLRMLERHYLHKNPHRLGDNPIPHLHRQPSSIEASEDMVLHTQGRLIDVIGDTCPNRYCHSIQDRITTAEPNEVLRERFIASPFMQFMSDKYTVAAGQLDRSSPQICRWVRHFGISPKLTDLGRDDMLYGYGASVNFNPESSLSEEEKTISESLHSIETRSGLLGWAHQDVRPGDHVYLLLGSSIPMVFRPIGHRDGDFVLVGDAWILWPKTQNLLASCPWLSEEEPISQIRIR